MINDHEATNSTTTDATFNTERTATNDDVISTLNGLIQTCKDGEEGFREAAVVVESSETKSFFAEKSRERSHFVGELQTLVRTLGGDPESEGTVTAALHRGWLERLVPWYLPRLDMLTNQRLERTKQGGQRA